MFFSQITDSKAQKAIIIVNVHAIVVTSIVMTCQSVRVVVSRNLHSSAECLVGFLRMDHHLMLNIFFFLFFHTYTLRKSLLRSLLSFANYLCISSSFYRINCSCKNYMMPMKYVFVFS